MSKKSEYASYMQSVMEAHLQALHVAAQSWAAPPGLPPVMESWVAELAETKFAADAIDRGIEYEAFTNEWLRYRVSRLSAALYGTGQILTGSGLMATLDDQYSVMASALRADYWSRMEIRLMRSMGFSFTRRELEALTFRVRESERLGHRTMAPSQAFSTARQVADEAHADFDFNQSLPPGQPKKKPRIFKGLGKCVTGVALTLADIGGVTSTIAHGFAPEVTAGGAMTSIVTGVGALLEGVGEFKAE